MTPRIHHSSSMRSRQRSSQPHRHGKHHILNLAPDVPLGRLLEVSHNKCADFLGSKGDALTSRVDLQVHAEVVPNRFIEARHERKRQAAPLLYRALFVVVPAGRDGPMTAETSTPGIARLAHAPVARGQILIRT